MPFSVKKGRAHLERVRGSGFVGTEPPASAWGRACQILEGGGQQGPYFELDIRFEHGARELFLLL